MPGQHERALEALHRRGRLRSLQLPRGTDFTSNDYLGLAQSGELRAAIADALERGVPVGAGGSRLLRGHHPEHEALESEAAVYFGSEAALYFGSGYAANTAIFSTLPARGDLVVYDALIHASAHDGMRLSKAETSPARHNDAQAFEDAIVAWRNTGGVGTPWIAVESLYSMDGDRAPLASLAEIAARHDAMLIIDEAHATGVLGLGGRGLGAHLEGRANIVTLHTCGKALGVSGALVLSSRVICDYLINRARAFIYATAPSPLMAAGVRVALRISGEGHERRDTLSALVDFAGRELQAKTGIVPSGSQIQPIILGADGRAVAIAEAMRQRGFDIRAIRPPTVPEGTARLRLTLTLHSNETDVVALISAIAEEQSRLAA